jgi:hypothetical protein
MLRVKTFDLAISMMVVHASLPSSWGRRRGALILLGLVSMANLGFSCTFLVYL